jgi:Carboxypeptidase regulatory-like domain
MRLSTVLRSTQLSFITLLGLSAISSGQVAPPRPPVARPSAGIGVITGKLADSVSGRPIAGGSVTVRHAGDSVFVNGALPRADGGFRIEGLQPGKYTVRVRAIGFAPLVRNDIEISAATPEIDLGTIVLKGVVVTLDAQQTVAEREDVVIQPIARATT